MADHEQIEKVRQEIMRFHELLAIMRIKLEAGEKAYATLITTYSPPDAGPMKEKDLQWKVAENMVDDLSPLRKAVMQTRFDARELEKAFEELYDIIVTPYEGES